MPLVTSSINLTDEKRVKELEDRSRDITQIETERGGKRK